MKYGASYTLIDVVSEFKRARVLAQQGVYARRLPSEEAISIFEGVKEWLVLRLAERPQSPELLDWLSQVHECLLEYQASRSCLLRAIELGLPKSRKIATRLYRLQRAEAEWLSLNLSPVELKSLGEYLMELCTNIDLQRLASRDRTEQWILLNCPERRDRVLKGLDSRGAYSDWQVLMNVVRG